MKADRSPEQRHGSALLSLCRNMEECAQKRPPVILTQADISLIPCFGGWKELAIQEALSLNLNKCGTLLQCRAWISPSAPDYFSHGHFHFFSVIIVGRWTSLQCHIDGQKGYSIFYILRIKVTRESKLSVNISRRLFCLPIKQAINEIWASDVPGQITTQFTVPSLSFKMKRYYRLSTG